MKHPHCSLIAAVALVFCGMPSVSLAETAATPELEAKVNNKAARPRIEVGMTGDQVRAIAGKPDRIKPLKKEGMKAEIWLYKFNRPVGMKQVATGTRFVPWTEPITGVTKMIPDPIISMVQVFESETTELLMIDGVLTSSKRYRNVGENY